MFLTLNNCGQRCKLEAIGVIDLKEIVTTPISPVIFKRQNNNWYCSSITFNEVSFPKIAENTLCYQLILNYTFYNAQDTGNLTLTHRM